MIPAPVSPESIPGSIGRCRRPGRPAARASAGTLLALILAVHTTPAAAQVNEHATWKYHATGEDLGTGWRAPGYVDADWPSGPGALGYGEDFVRTIVPYGPDPDAKFRTTYFRISFDPGVDPGGVVTMTMNALYDDGFVAYLNGQEVARRALPEGDIAYGTFASQHEAVVPELIDLSAHVAWLQPGANVLAVELHQAGLASSDLVWDASLTCSIDGPRVTRGPYVQNVTTGSAIIRWRTDVPTDAALRYAPSGEALAYVIEDEGEAIEHEIEVSGLDPGTRYDYAVGSRDVVLAGGGPGHHFTTAPTDVSGAVRIWAVGDPGTGDAHAAAVRDAYLDFAGERPADLWITLGDNAYEAGTDSEFQAAVFDLYADIMCHTPLWPSRGNHDVLYAPPAADYYQVFSLPKGGGAGGLPSRTEAYYAIDFRNVHLICLDSEGSDRSPGSDMLTWLADDLAAADKEWVIAYWHHCPYSKGSHDSDDPFESEGKMKDMRANVLPVLEAGGVDLVLSGHSHGYERSFLLDGHYGTSETLTPSMVLNHGDGRADRDGPYRKPPGRTPHAGTVYVVAGSSGKLNGGPFDHPVMVSSILSRGSMVVDVEGARLDARFLDDQGVVRDSFAIAKDLPLGVPAAGPTDVPALRRARPNPFAGHTSVGFTLARAGEARLRLLDATGRVVRTLADGAWTAGAHVLEWDGRDDAGATVSAGVYFAVLEADGRRESLRIVRVE